MENTMLDETTKKHVDMWLTGNVDEDTKNQIRTLVQNNPKEILEAFYTQLSFGTGGLRGIMGIGTNRMNQYTVRMATQGLANHLLQQHSAKNRHSVFIGYDSRHHSRTFAEETARVLAANGIRAYIFKTIHPTPLVSFGCRHLRCAAAVMQCHASRLPA